MQLRRATFALMATVGLILMTGCAVFTDPTRAAPARWLEPPTVSLMAQQLFSKEQITSAYDELTTLTFERSFEPALLDPQRTYSADQLNAGVFERMTPALQQQWTARVASALSGNEEAKDGVRLLRFFEWEQKTWRLPPGGSPLINQRIRNVEIGAAPATAETPQRLKVTLIVDAAMEFEDGGVTFPMEVSKRISHWLVPAEAPAAFAWKLDEYEGVFAVNAKLPVEKNAQTELPPAEPAEVGLGESTGAMQDAVPAGQPAIGNRTPLTAADAPPTRTSGTTSAAAPVTSPPAPAPAPAPAANPPAPAPPATTSSPTRAPANRRTTASRTTVPRPTVPRTTASRPTVPRPTVPRTTASRPTASRTTASRPTVPRTTAPRTTASRTTASRTTAARPTASRTTAPQATAPTNPSTTTPPTTSTPTTAPTLGGMGPSSVA